ncbi:PAS domain S-box protein [Candidatus Formimonas warabiya]|nr:PAS domain S-box protein [Candidatus Formimonas warabiya]
MSDLTINHNEIIGAIDRMPDFFSVLDKEYRITYLNKAMQSAFSGKSEDLIGRSILDMIDHEEDLALFNMVSLAMKEQKELNSEIFDGAADRWYEWSAYPLGNGLAVVRHDMTRHRKLEQTLCEREEKYRARFFNSPAIELMIDFETGDILDFTQAALDFYGYSDNELKGMKIYEINTADLRTIFRNLKEVKRFHEKSFFYQHRLKNGEIRDVEVYSGLTEIFGKKIVHSIIFDITDKQRMEQELRESQERLAWVIRGSKAGIWDYDLVHHRLYIDKQWKAILGYEEHEIPDELGDWRSRCHPEDRSRVTDMASHYITGKNEKYELEYRMRHKNGTYRWVHATGKLIFDWENCPIRFVGSIIDVTDHKQVEELHHEMEERLKEFAQAVPDASFIVDEDGRHIEIFGNYQKIIPFPKEQLIGRRIQEVMPGEDGEVLLNEVKQCLLTNESRYRVDERKRGEKNIWIEGRVVPMDYRFHGKRTVAVVLTDVTKQRQSEKMLQFNYELRRKSDFFNDIIGGKISITEKSKLSAQSWGVDFAQPLICCLLSLKKPLDPQERQNNGSVKAPIHQDKEDLLKLLSTIPECIVWDCRERIGIVSHHLTVNDQGEKGLKIIGEIREKVRTYAPDLIVTIGVGKVHSGPDSFETSFLEAESALAAILCKGKSEEVTCYYQDLGLFQLLPSMSGHKLAPNYVETMIGPLIAYDLERGTDLLKTLEEILQNASMKEAAEKMFLHRKTLVFRKKRIEKILGVLLEEFEMRMALAAAIKLHKLKNITNN